MNDQGKPVSRPWRRFLRFSVRGMIVIVLLVGGWLGWMGAIPKCGYATALLDCFFVDVCVDSTSS